MLLLLLLLLGMLFIVLVDPFPVVATRCISDHFTFFFGSGLPSLAGVSIIAVAVAVAVASLSSSSSSSELSLQMIAV